MYFFQCICHRERGKFKLKNSLTTAKKLGIAVDDIFRNSRPVVDFKNSSWEASVPAVHSLGRLETKIPCTLHTG
jgi:hypothetical protein